MKTLITIFAGLLAGLVIGWAAGRSQESHKTTEVVEQMMETMESYDAARAIASIKAIKLIESQQFQKASDYLTRPIADYEHSYSHLRPTEDRTNVLMQIKAAAAQFQVVARAIEQKTP